MTTTGDMDNDLLTIWLRAGELSADETRDLVERLQRLRLFARQNGNRHSAHHAETGRP